MKSEEIKTEPGHLANGRKTGPERSRTPPRTRGAGQDGICTSGKPSGAGSKAESDKIGAPRTTAPAAPTGVSARAAAAHKPAKAHARGALAPSPATGKDSPTAGSGELMRVDALKPLPRSFYDRETVLVAHEILGKLIIHRVDGAARVGRIVEVEAYLGPGDLAAHTSRGITPRTRAMFGPPGHIYVYLVYGMHHCMNIVTEPDGTGTAVLLRALEPVANLDVNTRGPGRLCKALGINLSHYGADVVSDTLFLAEDPSPPGPVRVVARPRVGVDYAGPWAQKLLRFYIEGNRFVSKK